MIIASGKRNGRAAHSHLRKGLRRADGGRHNPRLRGAHHGRAGNHEILACLFHPPSQREAGEERPVRFPGAEPQVGHNPDGQPRHGVRRGGLQPQHPGPLHPAKEDEARQEELDGGLQDVRREPQKEHELRTTGDRFAHGPRALVGVPGAAHRALRVLRMAPGHECHHRDADRDDDPSPLPLRNADRTVQTE